MFKVFNYDPKGYGGGSISKLIVASKAKADEVLEKLWIKNPAKVKEFGENEVVWADGSWALYVEIAA